MKFSVLILFLFITSIVKSQFLFDGVWQGLVIPNGTKTESGLPIYIEIKNSKGNVSAKCKEEYYNSDLYAFKKINISIKEKELTFQQQIIEKKKTSPKVSWCLLKGILKYDDSTGYLSGNYESTDCKRVIGKIILFRSKTAFSTTESPLQTHIWVDHFVDDLYKGYNAPEIREIERKNFVYEPIFFDYDKDEIKSEYYPFLLKMIRVVNSHTDLRIKVTGNTDSDGSDIYNEDLSKRRAEAIIKFFVENGLSRDRIKIEFNGEKKPIDTNKTPEGKQKNRRVDFEFI